MSSARSVRIGDRTNTAESIRQWHVHEVFLGAMYSYGYNVRYSHVFTVSSSMCTCFFFFKGNEGNNSCTAQGTRSRALLYRIHAARSYAVHLRHVAGRATYHLGAMRHARFFFPVKKVVFPSPNRSFPFAHAFGGHDRHFGRTPRCSSK